jgi:hypothetical protein
VNELFLFPNAVKSDPSVEVWFASPHHEMRQVAKPWFDRLRASGPDVCELVHDGHPTACLGPAAFGYVDAFSAHINIGFYFGAALTDPQGLLEGGGKRVRHVKVHWGQPVDTAALEALIAEAYRDIHARLSAGT